MKYRVKKVLNNNVVVSEDEEGSEIIVTGNGIGYGVKVGGAILENKIKRIYVPETREFVHRFSVLLDEIPYECFDEAEKIKEMAEEMLHEKLHQNLIITLADHISFALSQYEKGNSRIILLNEEIKRYYPDEFNAGKRAMKMIERRFHVQCKDAEAAAVAFHIINAETGGSSDDASRIMQSIQDIIKIVEDTMQVSIREDSMDYSRMIIHLKFFLRRVLTGTTYNEQFGQLLLNPDEGIFKGIALSLNAIDEYMKKTYSHSLNETERVYLLIHIARVVQNTKD